MACTLAKRLAKRTIIKFSDSNESLVWIALTRTQLLCCRMNGSHTQDAKLARTASVGKQLQVYTTAYVLQAYQVKLVA